LGQDPSSANHSWAVALGLVPCLAAWALQLVQQTIAAAAAVTAAASGAVASTGAVAAGAGVSPVTLPAVMMALDAAGAHPFGMVALSQG